MSITDCSMINFLIWLMGSDPKGNWGGKGPIVHLCEMIGFAPVLALGIMLILRRGKRNAIR